MKRFNKILCVVNPETTMETAIVHSVRIANDHQADITFMSVIREAKFWRKAFSNKEEYTEGLDELLKNKRSAIERSILSIAPSAKFDVVVVSGIAFVEVIQRVINRQHDLVVKCAEGMDWMDRMLGSEDMHLLRKCPCPVLMLKPAQKDSFQKVLATVDVNDDFAESDDGQVQAQLNEQVLEYSAALCLPKLSEMHIVNVWEDYAEDFYRYGVFSYLPKDEVDEYVEQTRLECSTRLEVLVRKMDRMLGKTVVQYLQPRSHLVKGKASKEIPLMVEKYGVDLIVMGTVGRVGISGFIIGNTAETILEQVQCSILAIKPDGFETPIL